MILGLSLRLQGYAIVCLAWLWVFSAQASNLSPPIELLSKGASLRPNVGAQSQKALLAKSLDSSLSLDASKSRIEVGDLAVLTLRMRNDGSEALGSDLNVVARLPAGWSFAGGSTNSDTLIPAGSSAEDATSVWFQSTLPGGNISEGTLLAQSSGNRWRRMGPFDLAPQAEIVIRYLVRVHGQETGTHIHQAQIWQGNTPVSKIANASIDVASHANFSEATLIGRVYCEDLSASLDERVGWPGVRIYLDSGAWAETDLDGKYHFRGVAPGRHLLKVDHRTLPPVPDDADANDLTRQVLREVTLTPGLLAHEDFGFVCGIKKFVPKIVVKPKGEAKPVEVAVQSHPPKVRIDGHTLTLPYVDAHWMVQPQGSKSQANVWGWQTEIPPDVRVAHWRFSLWRPKDLTTQPLNALEPDVWRDAVEVWRAEGEGAVPPFIHLKSHRLGGLLAYNLTIESVYGDRGEGPWHVISAPRISSFQSGEDAAQPYDGSSFKERGEVVAHWPSDLLIPSAKKTSKRLKQKMLVLRDKLVAHTHVPAHIWLEVHTGSGSSMRALAQTQVRAQKLVLAFQALWPQKDKNPPLWHAWGRGRQEPKMVGMGRRIEQINTRAVVRVQWGQAKQTKIHALGVVALPRALHVAGQKQVGGWDQNIKTAVSPGDALDVRLQGDTGHVWTLHRTMPFLGEDGGGRGGARLRVRGSLTPEGANLWVGNDKIESKIWDVDCAAMRAIESMGTISPNGLDGKKASKDAVHVVLQGAHASSIIAWKARIFGPTGLLLKELVAEPQSPSLIWDGRDTHGASVLGAGPHQVRCLLEHTLGHRLVTATRFVAAGEEIDGRDGRDTVDEQDFVNKAQAGPWLLRGNNYPSEDALSYGAEVVLRSVAGVMKRAPDFHVQIEVHDDGSDGGRVQAQLRTVQRGAKLMAYLNSLGVDPARLEMRPRGARSPAMAGVGHRAQAQNRRVWLRLIRPDAVSLADGDSLLSNGDVVDARAHLRVLGSEVALDASGAFDAQVQADRDGILRLNWRLPTGARAALKLRIQDGAWISGSAWPMETAFNPEPDRFRKALSLAKDFDASMVQNDTEHRSSWNASSRIAALDWSVLLPKDQSRLRGRSVAMRGQSALGNRITINGERVFLQEGGVFAWRGDLAPGLSEVDVVVEDPSGHQAHLKRSYQVPPGEWFAMALGEAVVGRGEAVLGTTPHSEIALPSGFYAHGRARAYVKARVDGVHLLGEKSPFEEYRIAGFVDSGAMPQERILRRGASDILDDASTLGDQGEDFIEGNTRYKGYLRLEADDSSLTAGNFKTDLSLGELFQFRRSFFGAQMVLDHRFAPGHRSEVRVFGGDKSAEVGHRELMLHGTGGRVFWLRDRDVVPGSERVHILVRDPIHGRVVHRITQQMDVDYVLDPKAGRLVFTKPIPIYAGGLGRVSGRMPTLDPGGVVVVEVVYDHRNRSELGGRRRLGAQVRHTLFDRITLGAGYIEAQRGDDEDSDYRLAAAQAEILLTPHTRLGLEGAYAEAEDTSHQASFDGGLSYVDLLDPDAEGSTPRGWALDVTLDGDLAEVLEAWSTIKLKPAPFSLYVRHQDRGFVAGDSVVQRGQSKAGLSLGLEPWQNGWFEGRHDAQFAVLGAQSDAAGVWLASSSLVYTHRFGRFTVGGEVGHRYIDGNNVLRDSVLGRNILGHNGVLALKGGYRFSSDWALDWEMRGLLGSQALYGGNSNWDRLITSVGVRYAIAKDLELSIRKSLRWSGVHAAEIGLQSVSDDGLRVYARERFERDLDGAFLGTTVVGAEGATLSGGRTFVEYRLPGQISGERGRAVLGTSGRWEPLPGLRVGLQYARSQNLAASAPLGHPSYASQANAVLDEDAQPLDTSAPFGILQAQASKQATYRQYAKQLGVWSGTLFASDVAAIQTARAGGLPATLRSRDAASASIEYLSSASLKASANLGIRYDAMDSTDAAGGDRLAFSGRIAGDWSFHRDMSMLGQLEGSSVVDPKNGALKAQYLDVSVGFALRPADTDRYAGILRWTRRIVWQGLVDEASQNQTIDVLSLAPSVRLGKGFSVSGKLALRLSRLALLGAHEDVVLKDDAALLLGLMRLDYRFLWDIYVACEYRWLGDLQAASAQEGALIEAGWHPHTHVGMGLGYNFSRVSDGLLNDPGADPHGFFLRVSGRY